MRAILVVSLAATACLLAGIMHANNADGGPAHKDTASRGQDKAPKSKQAQSAPSKSLKDPKPRDRTARFMRAKLAAAQDVLEALVIEDFEKMKQGANKMIVISQAAGWQVVQGPVYAQDSANFRNHARKLVTMAEKKNLEGATLDYMQLTLACIRCHQHVRSAKVAVAPAFGATALAARAQ